MVRASMRPGSTQRSALVALSIRVAAAAIVYVSQVLLARWMGPFQYGVFVFVWVWVLILGGLGPIGLSTSATRFVANYRQRHRMALLRGLIFSSRLIAVGVSCSAMAVGIALLWAFGDRLESHYVIPAMIILLCLPAYTLVDVQDGIARGFGWLGVALAPPYLIRHGLILVGVFIALMLGWRVDAVTAAISAIAACWIAAAVQTFILQSRLNRMVPAGPRHMRVGPWVAAALPVFLVQSFEMLLQNTDVLVIAHFRSPEDVGMYYAALKTIGLVSFIHFAVAVASAYQFSAAHAARDDDALRRKVHDAVTWTFWPSLLLAAALLVLGKPLLGMFGAEFTAAYPAMFVLAVGFIVRAAMGPAEYVLNMLGEQKACALALSLAAAINLVLNLLLVPEYGMMGAAIGTAVAVVSASLMMAYVAWKRLGLTLFIGARLLPRSRT